MLFSSCATLCFHIPLGWALVSKLKLGMCVIARITTKIFIFLLYPKAQWNNIEKSLKVKWFNLKARNKVYFIK